ncbi:MAG TPA: trehalose-6-phosphate synthase [Pseudomonadales bacterium]|nr:trehalose-6-phosphate synthase [Pseudomonadales bacterium]
MKFILRFIVPVFFVLALLVITIAPVVERITQHWFEVDLKIRSQLIVNAVKDSVEDYLKTRQADKVEKLFYHITHDERLDAIGLCDSANRLLVGSTSFPKSYGCNELTQASGRSGEIRTLGQKEYFRFAEPILAKTGENFQLILLHDFGFVHERSEAARNYILYFLILTGLSIVLVNIVIARWSWRSWITNLHGAINAEFSEQPVVEQNKNGGGAIPEVEPIVTDLKKMISEFRYEQQTRELMDVRWTADTLKLLLKETLSGSQILIVSNREPYIHSHSDTCIEVVRPASGLVTALEPVMRACAGTWIAHGSGNADKEVVDKNNKVQVPPENPAYSIRRIWLTEEEERGYYYGFANEGLWPLCHIAHVRPTFRSSDWEYYVQINRRFADAVIAEATSDDPVILVQDYHFALLPRMIREKLPDATTITFWHIPWPNPETFGICPWREQLLDGLLGSNILGFHTQFHCNNFFDAIDRYVEARIDRETFTSWQGGFATNVKAYPISIEWPQWGSFSAPAECCRSVYAENDISDDIMLGVGVDRLDYTKGVIERFLAVERLLELEPKWIGKFTFIQIGAPTRNGIPQYRQFEAEVKEAAARINQRFGSDRYQPIVLRVRHHDPEEVNKYYRAARFCYVSSLHDGMNLVAKEFIAARDDERGVLVLSQFTGAARELTEALIVNPYHIDQCALALRVALEMPEKEQQERMRGMRTQVEENNAYRWAGAMLLDAARIRQQRTIKSAISLERVT